MHPKYKTKYRVGNWPAYDRALVQRGDVTLWLAPEAITRWEAAGVGKRGGQLQYSDVAIETALTLHLPLRQTEGFLRSIFGMLGLDLSAPDHTTLSRRAQRLNLTLRRVLTGTGIHLIVDSTGLSMVGDGEWAAVKHGSRGTRGWKKLHLGVDGTGVIVAHALTGGHVDDATTALDLINTVEGDVSCLTADAAYDTRGIYEAAGARGATVVIPPTRTATLSGRRPRSPARDRTIRQVQQVGRRQWKKDSGYHQQARVENAFFRHKLRRALVNVAREPLHGEVEIDDTWVGGPQPGLRGSRQLKGRKAAIVLVAAEKRGRGSGRIRMAMASNFKQTTMRDFVKRHVKPGATVYTDGLKGFAGLEAAGVSHVPRIQPLRSALRKGTPSVVPLADRAIGNLQQWLIGTYHGVSKAQLPVYLDEFVFRHNRRWTPQAAFQTLLGLGTGRAPTPYRRIRHARDVMAHGG